MVFLYHPDYATLNRFADGELESKEHRRVSAHLADCSRCRGEVAFIRRAGSLARSIETPPVPEAVLDRVLERRAGGERVLLPLESPGAKPTRRRAIPAAAAAVVVLLAGLFAGTGLLEADHGGLTFEPERPRAGELLSVRYDGIDFADEASLHLKVRYRTDSGREWEQIAAILDVGDDGGFETEVQLPDSVVYAAFVVEDLWGRRMDNNNGRLWDVMVFGAGGRATREALWERTQDLNGRDRLEALRTADILIDLYPESPRGWVLRFSLNSETLRDPAAFVEEHRERFRLLERELTEDPPADPEEFAAMAFYATQLGETASAEYWLRQAKRRGARGAIVPISQSYALGLDRGRPPSEVLEDMEAVWQAAPFAIPQVATNGWFMALRTGDWQSALRWLPRYRESRGALSIGLIIEGLRGTFSAERVVAWARAEGEEMLFAPMHRPITRPAWLHGRVSREVRQDALAQLAEAARETGDLRSARTFALQGMHLAWETRSLETIAGTLLEAGDTVNAAVAFARAAADPFGPVPPDAVLADARWTELLGAAQAELTQYVLRESVMRYPNADETAPGRPTVIAFQWDCPGFAEKLPELVKRTGDARIELVLIGGLGQPLQPCGLPVPVRMDWGGEITREYGVRRLPSYYVTDAQGRIRFAESEYEDVPRQLAALRTQTDSSVTD